MNATITIIIPCFNAENYLDRCLQSVEEQTIGMEKLQIILIDDASTDHSLDKMLQWQAKYPFQIQIVRNAKNKRQGTCRNMGVKKAEGEYIAFLDADDWLEPQMYEELLRVMQVGECDFVQCMCSHDKEYRFWKTLDEKNTGKPDRLILIEQEEDRCNMIASNLLGTYVVTKLYRKSFITEHEIQFPEHLLFEDIYWMGLLNCYAHRIGIVEQRLYHYFLTPNSVSRARNRKENRDIVTVNRLLWQEYQTRGLLTGKLKDALSYELLCTYYLTTTKMLFLRYDEIPYEQFYEMQEELVELLPNYAANPYINDYTSPFNILLLGLLDKKLSRADIDSAANSMRLLMHANHEIVALN